MTWRSHSCPPIWRFSAFHAVRASAAIALCFFAFHVPLAIIAPYALLYRTHTGLPVVCQCRLTHWMALVNATNAARLPVIVCTFGVAILIWPPSSATEWPPACSWPY